MTKSALFDPRISAWFADHYGMISRGHAIALGLTSAQIAARVRSGSWEVVYRGVYRLAGSRQDELASLQAAVLAGGPEAAVSHRSAAWLWGLTPTSPGPDLPTITVPRNHGPHPAGIRVVRSRRPLQPVLHQRLPCTSALRTVVDCATVMDSDEFDRLVDTALAHRMVAVDALSRLVGDRRLRYHDGRRFLEERLAARGMVGSPHPSVLESRMARLFRRHRLPQPKAEVAWGPDRRYRLDFAFPELRLAIEVDGWSAHFTPEQQRHDKQRGNALARSGWTVLHFDWWDVTYAAEQVAAEIAGTYRRLRAAA